MRRSRVSATLGAAALASATSMWLAAPALAYPPGNSSNISLSASDVPAGGTLTATDTGNSAGETVDGFVHSVRVFVGSTTANSSGRATLTFTVPTSLPAGTHTMQMVGQSSGHVGSATFVITKGGVGSSSSSSSGLPFTGGNDIWQMTAAGVGLVLVGGAAVVVVRRRRSHAGLAA